MWSLLATVFGACIYASQATDYATSKLSHTYVKTSKWSLKASISMSVTDNKVELTLVGPSDVWFSFGFGNKYMDNTYSIIVDGDGKVSERCLSSKGAGDELDDTWTVESYVESSHYRTVVLTREYDYQLSSELYHEFSTSYSKLETIWAYGSDSDLDNHGQLQRGNEQLSASRGTASLTKSLWGDVTTNVMEEEYDAYLTTSTVLTWIVCGVALCVIAWFCYQRWLKNQYNEIPDDCKANISMVPMGTSIESRV